MEKYFKLIDKLEENGILLKEEFVDLIENRNSEIAEYLFEKARKIRQKYYKNDVFIRGLIEFTNYCKNDCLYCGIRRSNQNVDRYRLNKDEILSCCKLGYELGFRTFVLQGGEDGFYDDEKIVDIIKNIKKLYSDCVVTLSIGEKSKESYQKYFDAGASRYLLRHETATEEHYQKLHPKELSLKNRKRCLTELKEIGFQTGCGFMVGSPLQTVENLAEDLLFLSEFQPQMVGIGPFIPHKDTPFKDEKIGNSELTLFLLGLVRLILPSVLLPATTALSTVSEDGHLLGILAGANVVMPNLSPMNVRNKYLIYDNKANTGTEAAECLDLLERKLSTSGYKINKSRGDYNSNLV